MEKVIKVQNLSVFFRDEGSGDAILILHGWGSRSDSWHDVQKDLVSYGYRVLVPDLPGFGQTSEPPSTWSLKEYSQFVRDFTQHVGLKHFTLLGHSFGGRIAVDYTLRYQEQIHTLILADAAGMGRHKKFKTRIFFILTKLGDKIFSIKLFRFARPIVQKIWYKLTRENDYYRASYKMKKIMAKILKENLRSRLHDIKRPTLILWGEKDRLTPIADAVVINRHIPAAHLHIFPNVGHAINLETPAHVARQINRFLMEYK